MMTSAMFVCLDVGCVLAVSRVAYPRVAPRLTENRVPGGRDPEPSESEPSPGPTHGIVGIFIPGTRRLFYIREPPRLEYTLIYTTCTRQRLCL